MNSRQRSRLVTVVTLAVAAGWVGWDLARRDWADLLYLGVFVTFASLVFFGIDWWIDRGGS